MGAPCRVGSHIIIAVVVASACGLVAQAVQIPTITISDHGLQLPMLSLGDGASWGRPSNYTKYLMTVGKGAGIDSAWDYGQFGGLPPQSTHGSETLIPPQIVASGYSRIDTFITTKIPCGEFDGSVEPMNASTVQIYIEANLKMLNTTYIDLLLLHHVCHTREETVTVWRAMESAKASGAVRAIGVSNFVVEDLEALRSAGLKEKISANQCQFTVGRMDWAMVEYAKEHGIALESYGTLHGPVDMQHPTIQAIAAKHNVSAVLVGLKYVSQRMIAIVTASNTTEYDQEDASLFEWSLSADDLAAIDKLQGAKKRTCSDCFALPCRACATALELEGCKTLWHGKACMACSAGLNATAAARVARACGGDEDVVSKACWD